MAKLQRELYGEFDVILHRIHDGILSGSVSATLEDESNICTPNCRCAVRVYERYSWMGNNRLSMSITLLQEGTGPIYLTAITSGGSQAVFFKMNTIGEDAFLNKLRDLLDSGL